MVRMVASMAVLILESLEVDASTGGVIMSSIVRACPPLLVFLMMLTAGSADAAVHLVNCDTGPFLTITDALAAATDGDSIVVEVM